jgi:serine/threonine-protein kinase
MSRMSSATKPPAFHCPACGRKHRTKLGALKERPGSTLHLACAGCGTPLAVSLGPDGAPVCRPAGDAGDAPEPPAASAAPAATPAPAPAPQEAPVAAEFSEGDVLGRYTIERPLARGNTSTVYQAFDPTTNRSVALKVLAKDAGDVMRQRFLREIEVQANIRHQNIMPVFDRGALRDDRPFFTMELLHEPWTLAEIIEGRDGGRLARHRALAKLADLETLVRDVIVPVADGIYVANVENGVIHRDLKPDNVLVDSSTLRPYVIDFGICHVLERKTGFGSKAVIPPTTEDEGIVGTPRYLAPEQVRGNVNARTDVWGLGAMLFTAIGGEPPLVSAQNISRSELRRRIAALEVTKRHAEEKDDERKIALCDEQLVRLRDPALRTLDDLFRDARDARYAELPASTPAPLRAVVRKALAASTSDRYVNARQLASELQAWLDGRSVRALAEAGGKAAAVESARRALRTHLVTALWVLGGLAVGLLVARGTAGERAAPASTRVADAEADIQLLADNVTGLERVAPTLTAVERSRLWKALDERGKEIAARLADEPDDSQVLAVRERLTFVRTRFAPPRVRVQGPPNLHLEARPLADGALGEAVRPLVPGENALPPGSYEVTSRGSLRFPLAVPFLARDPQAASRYAHEAPVQVVHVPAAEPPAGMVLVLGGHVLARDLPFDPPSTAATAVPAFFMDEAEVTNGEYAQFLASLEGAERTARAPKQGFVPDPQQDGAPIVIPGHENLPVVGVRPQDARAYAAWRSGQAGAVVRLPTDAEWALAAGATMGYTLANGSQGERTDGEFASPLRIAGAHERDVSPYGVRGLLANAREMVTSSLGDLDPGAVLVKGAGVGDDPDRGAIYLHRVLPKDQRQRVTGFRCVQELPGAKGPGR